MSSSVVAWGRARRRLIPVRLALQCLLGPVPALLAGVGTGFVGTLASPTAARAQVPEGGRDSAPQLVTANAAPGDSVHGRPLSLAEAVGIAEDRSPVIEVARNAILRTTGAQYQARSGLLPQLGASVNYTGTLKSQFQGVFGSSGSDTAHGTPAPPAPCTQYLLDPTAPTASRLLGLEQYARCAAANGTGGGFGGIDLRRVGFGAANAYTLGLSASQSLFTGGRIAGEIQSAAAGQRAARIELTAQYAQLTLDVTQAYYTAALTDRLLDIARSSLEQAEAQLRQVQLQQKVGNASEYDLLRATVARDNQRPVVVQRQSDREVAYLRLKQLLALPLEEPLRLTTAIEDSAALPPGVSPSRVSAPDTVTDRRATVREAMQNVAAQQGVLRAARAERLPALSLSSSYARLAYPGGFPAWGDFRPNWTVTLATSFPLFTGGRLRGDEMIARANLRDAESRLLQARQYTALDTRVALNALRQAEATLAASQGTAGVAERAYQIAALRYREGLSTQLELDDARNQLSQALANRALATRDVLIARVRLALLPDLPVQTQGAGQSTLSVQQQAQPSQLQLSPQQPVQQQTQSQGGASGGIPQGVGTF